MSGLLAFLSARGEAGAHRDAIANALECLHHRGPDATGVEVVTRPDGGTDAVFGHKRLAVTDVESSQEPLSYADGRYLLIYNGAIYNYIELREELARDFGAQFATRGDAEVVAAGYHYWGEQVLTRLRGMFAFLIWDRRERRAFGARDNFGVKPLHYLETTDGLYLASEKKALLPFSAAANSGDAGVNMANLSHYLTLQYVPETDTLQREIKRIGSGECFTWTPGGGLEVRRWYRPVFRPRPVDDPEKLYERIRETLRESVRLHMRADVPVGAFLSSGIDSTAVVALAREFNPNLLTFTVGYDVPGYSEIDVAQDSARHLEVTTMPTKIGPQEMMDALPKIVWHLDDPVADPALVPLYFVAKKAAEHVTVSLSGEGADEFFGGYTI
ncbi:MAG TPA: asparagine synthase (glutamine-hydrolyzing), partial [Micromonosporaceae bacterium]|nr:asparagine synthase (glutamine-hydrolyzing) [Micromonosporaceae bacterium]